MLAHALLMYSPHGLRWDRFIMIPYTTTCSSGTYIHVSICLDPGLSWFELIMTDKVYSISNKSERSDPIPCLWCLFWVITVRMLKYLWTHQGATILLMREPCSNHFVHQSVCPSHFLLTFYLETRILGQISRSKRHIMSTLHNNVITQ